MNEPAFTTTLRQIRAARAGDHAAREALFARYLAPVREIVARRLGRDLRQFTDIEDVLQESMLDAYGRIEHFRDEAEGKFIHWLAQIVENNIRDLRRRFEVRRVGANRRLSSGDTSGGIAPAAPGPSPSQCARAAELEVAFGQALAELHPQYRRLILMREVRGLSYEEIADELDYARVETPRQKLAVAKKKLRALLARFAPPTIEE